MKNLCKSYACLTLLLHCILFFTPLSSSSSSSFLFLNAFAHSVMHKLPHVYKYTFLPWNKKTWWWRIFMWIFRILGKLKPNQVRSNPCMYFHCRHEVFGSLFTNHISNFEFFCVHVSKRHVSRSTSTVSPFLSPPSWAYYHYCVHTADIIFAAQIYCILAGAGLSVSSSSFLYIHPIIFPGEQMENKKVWLWEKTWLKQPPETLP